MEYFKEFFGNIFGSFWTNIAEMLLKLLMGPVAFFLFGPLFKLSGYMANKLLNEIKPYLGDVGLTADSLAGWLVDCLRLQECASSLMTFLILGLMLTFVKKVF